MYSIISPAQFNTVKWKNGKGSTIELAVSNSESIAQFDWRLSIATVENNDVFSDFAGYDRQLILLKGNGITLFHENHRSDLSQLLTIAHFDGGDETHAKLHDGPITDFNVMVNKSTFQANVQTFQAFNQINLSPTDNCFVFALNHAMEITITSENISQEKFQLDANHLLNIPANSQQNIAISGHDFIIIELIKLG